MTRNSRSHHREERRKSAVERREARDARSHQQQLERLDFLFGKGKGAAKERARLKALIKSGEQRKPVPDEKAEPEKTAKKAEKKQ